MPQAGSDRTGGENPAYLSCNEVQAADRRVGASSVPSVLLVAATQRAD